ncbi:MAG: hypothetical protein MK212_22240, partial [Saprospiraceae bacterium]|nr:hypothetical protein [Saprospiraceae bacterium]
LYISTIIYTTMLQLPYSSSIPIRHLSATLSGMTNSYKIYWFWSLLDAIKTGDIREGEALHMDRLAIKMVALSWHTINTYKLSLGNIDDIPNTIKVILKETNLSSNSSKEEVEQECSKAMKKEIVKKKIQALRRYVPYRFLTPFFANELKGLKDAKKNKQTQEQSIKYFQDKSRCPIYLPQRAKIEFHPSWLIYFKENLSLLEGFCLWNLVALLQTRNPNIPNLGNKLFAPPKNRDLSKAKEFWKLMHKHHPIHCIYSQKLLSLDDFSIDHFIPWSFVTHDALWNLMPTNQSTNSSKSNNLPRLDKYFQPFAKLQFKAFKLFYSLNKKKELEDYSIAFGEKLDIINSYSEQAFVEKLKAQIHPLAQLAANLGFQENWVYTNHKKNAIV